MSALLSAPFAAADSADPACFPTYAQLPAHWNKEGEYMCTFGTSSGLLYKLNGVCAIR